MGSLLEQFVLLTAHLQQMGLSFQLTVLSGVRPMSLFLPSWHGANNLVPYTAQAVTSLSDPSPKERRRAGDRNALWCVIPLYYLLKYLITQLHLQVIYHFCPCGALHKHWKLFVLRSCLVSLSQATLAQLACHFATRQ